jgi:hypothetical protein
MAQADASRSLSRNADNHNYRRLCDIHRRATFSVTLNVLDQVRHKHMQNTNLTQSICTYVR